MFLDSIEARSEESNGYTSAPAKTPKPPPAVTEVQLKMWCAVLQRRKSQILRLPRSYIILFANDIISDLWNSRYTPNEYTKDMKGDKKENSGRSEAQFDHTAGHYSEYLLKKQLPPDGISTDEIGLHLLALFYRSVDDRLPNAMKKHGLDRVKAALQTLDFWFKKWEDSERSKNTMDGDILGTKEESTNFIGYTNQEGLYDSEVVKKDDDVELSKTIQLHKTPLSAFKEEVVSNEWYALSEGESCRDKQPVKNLNKFALFLLLEKQRNMRLKDLYQGRSLPTCKEEEVTDGTVTLPKFPPRYQCLDLSASWFVSELNKLRRALFVHNFDSTREQWKAGLDQITKTFLEDLVNVLNDRYGGESNIPQMTLLAQPFIKNDTDELDRAKEENSCSPAYDKEDQGNVQNNEHSQKDDKGRQVGQDAKMMQREDSPQSNQEQIRMQGESSIQDAPAVEEDAHLFPAVTYPKVQAQERADENVREEQEATVTHIEAQISEVKVVGQVESNYIYFRVIILNSTTDLVRITRRQSLTFEDLRRQIEEQVSLPFASFRFSMQGSDTSLITSKQEKIFYICEKDYGLMNQGDGSPLNPYRVYLQEAT